MGSDVADADVVVVADEPVVPAELGAAGGRDDEVPEAADAPGAADDGASAEDETASPDVPPSDAPELDTGPVPDAGEDVPDRPDGELDIAPLELLALPGCSVSTVASDGNNSSHPAPNPASVIQQACLTIRS